MRLDRWTRSNRRNLVEQEAGRCGHRIGMWDQGGVEDYPRLQNWVPEEIVCDSVLESVFNSEKEWHEKALRGKSTALCWIHEVQVEFRIGPHLLFLISSTHLVSISILTRLWSFQFWCKNLLCVSCQRESTKSLSAWLIRCLQISSENIAFSLSPVTLNVFFTLFFVI